MRSFRNDNRMFRKITITNFKSLAEVSTELGAFTVLVGNNGSGKSSFLQAIDVVSWTVKYDSISTGLLDYNVDFRDLVYLRAAHSAIDFTADLTITPPNSHNVENVRMIMKIEKKKYPYLAMEVVLPNLIRDPKWGIVSHARERIAEENGNKISHKDVAL